MPGHSEPITFLGKEYPSLRAFAATIPDPNPNPSPDKGNYSRLRSRVRHHPYVPLEYLVSLDAVSPRERRKALAWAENVASRMFAMPTAETRRDHEALLDRARKVLGAGPVSNESPLVFEPDQVVAGVRVLRLLRRGPTRRKTIYLVRHEECQHLEEMDARRLNALADRADQNPEAYCRCSSCNSSGGPTPHKPRIQVTWLHDVGQQATWKPPPHSLGLHHNRWCDRIPRANR